MQSKLPFAFYCLTGLSKIIHWQCLTKFQDIESDIFKAIMVISFGKMLPNGIFNLFATDGGKMVDHPVHKVLFGLTNIMHATSVAFYGINEVIRPAGYTCSGTEPSAI